MILIISYLLFFAISAHAYPEVWEKIQPYELHPNKILAEPLKIDINSADKTTLQKFTGIGPKRAQDIIDYRNQHGAFKKIEELQKVKGFTKKRFKQFLEDNKDLL